MLNPTWLIVQLRFQTYWLEKHAGRVSVCAPNPGRTVIPWGVLSHDAFLCVYLSAVSMHI